MTAAVPRVGRPSSISISPIPGGQDPACVAHDEALGVRILLTAIIHQAVNDLRRGSRLDKATAWRFFFTAHSCFELWCGRLNLQPDAIRAQLAHKDAEDAEDVDDGFLDRQRRAREAAIRGWQGRKRSP